MQARVFFSFFFFFVFAKTKSIILVKFTLENKIFENFPNFCVKKRNTECKQLSSQQAQRFEQTNKKLARSGTGSCVRFNN